MDEPTEIQQLRAEVAQLREQLHQLSQQVASLQTGLKATTTSDRVGRAVRAGRKIVDQLPKPPKRY